VNFKNKNYKYHYIYVTVNMINKKKYIGKHSTNNLEDSYIGSGKTLRKAIAKYGKQNFKKIILFCLNSVEEALDMEKKIVNEEIYESKDFYNLKEGGHGGVYSNETRNRISVSLRNSEKIKNKTKSEIDKQVEKGKQTRIKNGSWYKSGKDHHMFGKTHPQETWNIIIQKLKGKCPIQKGKKYEEIYGEEKSKEIKSKVGRDTSGQKNPCFGRVWLTKCGKRKYPLKESKEYCELLNIGYVEDSSVCVTTKNFVWLFNEKMNKRTYVNKSSDEYSLFLKNNFIEKKGIHLNKNVIKLSKQEKERLLNEY
jgi:hypothetical protein